MRFCLFLAAALCAEAGVVQGSVMESASGLPMARTRVVLQPVPGPNAHKPIQLRANSTGGFVFPEVADGLWILIAQREGYFPCAYGQKRPTGQGLPFEVTKDSKVFAELRMRRKGAITGKVVDENGLGLEGVPVFAYRNRAPLSQAGRGVSDDRGIYRIHGLDPGKYWVRSGSTRLDDGTGLVPTFGLKSRDSQQAHLFQVSLDTDTPYGDINPDQGNLASLSGKIERSLVPPSMVTVIASSETERRRAQTLCGLSYRFDSLPPANYEVFASKENEAGYIEVNVGGDSPYGTVRLLALPQVTFEIYQGGGLRSTSDGSVSVFGRRRDLWASEEEQQFTLPRAALSPGHWEMNARAGPNQYVESIIGGRMRRDPRAEQSPAWFDVLIEGPFPRVLIRIADGAAQIDGQVTIDSKGAPGAPVFLWPVAEAARRSLGGWKVALADIDGRFQFNGLPPGDYRLLSTFDVLEIDEEILAESRAPEIHVGKSARATAELPLWIAP
jgi:hypothetical protein